MFKNGVTKYIYIEEFATYNKPEVIQGICIGDGIMELSIQKWDDSAAVQLPSTLLSQLGVAVGDRLSADVRPEGLVLRPSRKTYSLADLMAQCDLKAAPPVDAELWESSKAVGREVR